MGQTYHSAMIRETKYLYKLKISDLNLDTHILLYYNV